MNSMRQSAADKARQYGQMVADEMEVRIVNLEVDTVEDLNRQTEAVIAEASGIGNAMLLRQISLEIQREHKLFELFIDSRPMPEMSLDEAGKTSNGDFYQDGFH